MSATGAGSCSGCEARHRGVDHEIVALPAAHRPRRPARPGARDELMELGVDEPLATGGLIDRRRPEPGQFRTQIRGRAHSCPTTWGSTR
jgi:hypothetical protein